MHGGIRLGVDIIDILWALALGARACVSSRALIYGMAARGLVGVTRAMQLVPDKLSLAMALSGAASVSQLDRSWIFGSQESGARDTASAR